MKAWLFPLRFLLVAAVCLGAGLARGEPADTSASAALRARYGQLQDQLARNPFQRPLYLESSEAAEAVTGSIHALIDYPFATAGAALNGPAHWCDILLLHLNTKYCRATIDSRGSSLRVHIGKKHEQQLNDAYPVDFAYRVAAATPDYLKVMLTAEEGPLSTRDYRIVLEAAPLEGGRTVLHLSYSYGYGFAGRVAMQAYLATIGRGKAGFTVVDKQADGRPIYIDGMRGLVERNTMRYYLAIEAYLGALSAPPQARLEQSLRDWFAASERYPRQLHELEQNEYLVMKRNEYFRSKGEARVP
jgi:hypothetical protein